MRAGRMRHRIIIQKRNSGTKDDDGFKLPESQLWDDFKPLWASINNLYGEEYWKAQKENSEKTVNFSTRYYSFIEDLNTKDYRIKWIKNGKERYFDITFIDNVKYENKTVIWKAEEVI